MTYSLLSESMPDRATIPGGESFAPWPTLLVVDGDLEMLSTVVRYFEKRGFHVAAASSLAEAKDFCHRRRNWTLAIADYHLPDGTGWELCCWIQEQPGWETMPFLLTSANLNCATLGTTADYLAKPFRLEALEQRVRALLHRKSA